MLTPDDAADLVEELLPAKIRSRQLGLALKIPRRVVDRIHRKFSKPRDQLFHLFIEFTNLSELRPTWSVIVDALPRGGHSYSTRRTVRDRGQDS